MESHLMLALDLLRKEVRVKYVSKDSAPGPFRDDEIYIEKHKLDNCPGEFQIITAIQKKIGRTDIFKFQKNTLGICILLLLSKGYCITSSVFENVDNLFIERCWECIKVVSDNIPDTISKWIVESMGSRSASGYSTIYCQSDSAMLPIEFLNKSLNEDGSFSRVDLSKTILPKVVWHRDDAVRQTMIFHLHSLDTNLSYDSK